MRHLAYYDSVLLSLNIYYFFGFLWPLDIFKDVYYNWYVGSSDSPVVWILFGESFLDFVRYLCWGTCQKVIEVKGRVFKGDCRLY